MADTDLLSLWRSRGLGRERPTICGSGSCGSNDLTPAAGAKILPVGGIGATDVCRTCCLDIVARTVGSIRMRARQQP